MIRRRLILGCTILLAGCGVLETEEQPGPNLPSRAPVEDPTIPSEIIAIETVDASANQDIDETSNGSTVTVDDSEVEIGNDAETTRVNATESASLLNLPLNQENPRRTDESAKIFVTVGEDDEAVICEILQGDRDFCQTGKVTYVTLSAASDELGKVDLDNEFLTTQRLQSGYHRISFESDGDLRDNLLDSVLGTNPNDEVIVLTCPDGLVIQ